MSKAGTKSSQGDDYQRLVAMHWLICLLNDDDISFIQAESNGLSDVNEKISVDDVVVVYTDGHRRHIQVKKNQPSNRAWSLSDLKDELPKICDQLESNLDTLVELYSQTPFGDLKSLTDASQEYPDLAAFQREAGNGLQHTLSSLASMWERTANDSFRLLPRLRFASHHTFEEWERLNKQELGRLVPQVDFALPILESFLNKHQSKLQATILTIHRKDVLQHLAQVGLPVTPMWSEAEVLDQFRQASSIGREWQRTVGGRKIERAELGELIRLVETEVDTVLVTDQPGSGKTCLLLDLADRIEQDSRFGLLFIKGDRFSKLHDDTDLKGAGLPEDVVGCCGRLSEHRKVVVIIDSLDVLSINREHGALGVFLGLIDRLQPIRSVTVVAACRSFDLKYDPLLRDREWEHKIHLSDFDYDEVVAPLLKEWGISEAQVDLDLQHLLQLPQNLRLYEPIAKRGGSRAIRNTYELHEAYLDEVVRKAPNLGSPAMKALQDLADRLLHDRTQLMHPSAFSADESIRRGLVSNGVLFQDHNGSLGFGHQTLFENLATYASLARDEDLAGFICSHPPFPFLRPAVRTFVFHLRTHAPQLFPRQVWGALVDDGVAYHFKRLIAESLSEIVPEDNDWPLLRRLFQGQPELFRRLFWRLEGDAWFRLLVDHWLPSLQSPVVDGEWFNMFANRLNCWMDTHPEDVVALWRRALSEGWGDVSHLARTISLHLHKFQHLATEGVPELIEALLVVNKEERDFLGTVISRYVAATDQGDDLLWRYIVRDVGHHDTQRLSFGNKLHCRPHDFHNKDFLKGRLACSDEFLSLAVNTIEDWATRGEHYPSTHQLRSVFLHSSSWERRHSQRDTHHTDAIAVLLDGIEHAFEHRSKVNDVWWQEHESQLRCTCEETLRYFLAKAYTVNSEANVSGIAALLADAELLRYGHIEYELGELIQAGYHLLSYESQEANQRVILDLYKDEDWSKEDMPQWAFKNIYEYLIWIPLIFRLPASQAFIERFQPEFGAALPEPHISSCGGWVGSPVSLGQLMELRERSLLRLLYYYNDYHEHSSHPADGHTGGRDMIERVLSEAAAHDPVRYLDFVPTLERHGLQFGYVTNLLEGIASHLRYRFGRLQSPQGWQPVKPEPDGVVLACSLLDLLERHPKLWKDGRAVAHMLEACCEVLGDGDSAERITLLLYRLLRHPNPAEDRQRIFGQGKEGITTDDLRSEAINSVRGIAAGSAIGLCNRLLEQEKKLPELLFPLLRHFAHDPVQAVRAALLDYLPFLTYKCRPWGWQLFHDIFREPQIHLWPLAERHLYHQYREHFDDVAPFLERMRVEAPEEAGSAWGRIATLISLSGRIGQDDLFQQLESLNTASAWKGAAQVFAANLDQHLNDDLCVSGLRRILKRKNLDEQVFNAIEHAFAHKSQSRCLDEEFVLHFIDAIKPGDRHCDLREFLDWIADLASRDPVAALTICERLAVKLSELKPPYQIWHTEPLIAVLSSILREADETDDEALINRAVRLQDQFLRMDINGIEDFFEQAARL